ARDPINALAVDRLPESSDLLQGVNVILELGPARKPVEPLVLELRIRDRVRGAVLHKVLRLVLEMPEIWTVGKRAWRCLRISRHSDLLSSKRPVSAHRAARRFASLLWTGGLLPFPRAGCDLYAMPLV